MKKKTHANPFSWLKMAFIENVLEHYAQVYSFSTSTLFVGSLLAGPLRYV